MLHCLTVYAAACAACVRRCGLLEGQRQHLEAGGRAAAMSTRSFNAAVRAAGGAAGLPGDDGDVALLDCPESKLGGWSAQVVVTGAKVVAGLFALKLVETGDQGESNVIFLLQDGGVAGSCACRQPLSRRATLPRPGLSARPSSRPALQGCRSAWLPRKRQSMPRIRSSEQLRYYTI